MPAATTAWKCKPTSWSRRSIKWVSRNSASLRWIWGRSSATFSPENIGTVFIATSARNNRCSATSVHRYRRDEFCAAREGRGRSPPYSREHPELCCASFMDARIGRHSIRSSARNNRCRTKFCEKPKKRLRMCFHMDLAPVSPEHLLAPGQGCINTTVITCVSCTGILMPTADTLFQYSWYKGHTILRCRPCDSTDRPVWLSKRFARSCCRDRSSRMDEAWRVATFRGQASLTGAPGRSVPKSSSPMHHTSVSSSWTPDTSCRWKRLKLSMRCWMSFSAPRQPKQRRGHQRRRELRSTTTHPRLRRQTYSPLNVEYLYTRQRFVHLTSKWKWEYFHWHG